MKKENTENIEIVLVDDVSTKKSFRKSWAQLIYKIFDVFFKWEVET